MIMQYDKIKKRPVQFLSITGLKLEDFNFLLPYFKAEWDEYHDQFHFYGENTSTTNIYKKKYGSPENGRQVNVFVDLSKNQPFAGTSCCKFWYNTITSQSVDSFIIKSFA